MFDPNGFYPAPRDCWWEVDAGALHIWRDGAPELAAHDHDELAAIWARVAPQAMLAVGAAAHAAFRWGPIAGVRRWAVRGGRLQAIVRNTVWSSPMEARCYHRGPSPGCWCGLYAVKPEAHRLLMEVWCLDFAVGVVSLYGRVIEHQHGWRAQYARIREVWLPEERFRGLDLDAYPGVTWHTWEGGSTPREDRGLRRP